MKTFGIAVPIPLYIWAARGQDESADAHIEYGLRAAKHSALEKMMDTAWHNRYWVIRIREEWPTEQEAFYAEMSHDPRVEYRLFFDISEVPRHDVVIELGPETWYISPSGPAPSIKDFIKLKWKQFRSR